MQALIFGHRFRPSFPALVLGLGLRGVGAVFFLRSARLKPLWTLDTGHRELRRAEDCAPYRADRADRRLVDHLGIHRIHEGVAGL